MKEFKDFTGMIFGMLTVIRQAEDCIEKSGVKRRAWLCQCECGSEPKIIQERCLLAEKYPTRSCGCARTTRLKEINKKYNQYDISGEYGIGWTNKGEEFYFDLEDYDLIKDYCWYLDNRYLKAKDLRFPNTDKKIRMHRLILNCPDDLEPNHKNYNTLDNRKENLEIVTHQENMAKRRPSSEWNFKKRNDDIE